MARVLGVGRVASGLMAYSWHLFVELVKIVYFPVTWFEAGWLFRGFVHCTARVLIWQQS